MTIRNSVGGGYVAFGVWVTREIQESTFNFIFAIDANFRCKKNCECKIETHESKMCFATKLVSIVHDEIVAGLVKLWCEYFFVVCNNCPCLLWTLIVAVATSKKSDTGKVVAAIIPASYSRGIFERSQCALPLTSKKHILDNTKYIVGRTDY